MVSVLVMTGLVVVDAPEDGILVSGLALLLVILILLLVTSPGLDPLKEFSVLMIYVCRAVVALV